MREFITSDAYMGGLTITFQGNVYLLETNKSEKLLAMTGLLSQIESEATQQINEYHGSRDFKPGFVRDVFTDKILKFDKRNPLVKDDPEFEAFVAANEWYVFNTLYGTSEEKPFVKMLDRQIPALRERYEAIYLVRNEGHFKIYNFTDGQAFEPDFVLFLRENGGKVLTYQLFIEPKGKQLKEHDKWKELFLKDISETFARKVLTIDATSKYRLVGVPFYSNEDENQFKDNLWSSLMR